ncbi:MAG: substrate-binding domain-containing protein [Chloroflexota bacterium]|jgi:ribose transport system substrate-binding protein
MNRGTLPLKRPRLAAAAITAAMALSLSATGVVAQEEPDDLAVVTINLQALFFNQLNDGAQAAADAAGANLQIVNANNDPAAQNDAIETLTADGVDGILVIAIDTNGIMPAVESAAEAGVTIVAADAILPEGPQIAQVGVDNGGAGAEMGEFFVDWVEAQGEPVQLGIVGALNSTIQNIRQEGFEEVVLASENVELVGVVDGQNVAETALAAAENLITANPELTAIYATGEPALVGAVAAVEAQGAEDRVKIFGWDLTSQVIAGIDAGFVEAVVQQDPAGIGSASIEALVASLAGEEVEPVIDVPITIVTTENVDDFRATFE